MKAMVLASSLRTAGNFMPVLDLMRARGDVLELAWIPLGGAMSEDPSKLGFATMHMGVHSRAENRLFWNGIEGRLDEGFDLVIMDDMIHWPAQEMAAAVRARRHPPALVAFQHGLYQAWNAMNRNFLADYFLCFGRRHVYNFDRCHWPRVLPTGLPKLDRIVPPGGAPGDCILYVAQSAPDPSIIGPMLADLRSATALPVRIRPHPGHLGKYGSLQSQFEFLPANEDITTQIASANWILTTHSSAVLEAMRMGVASVLLPSFGLTDFAFYPGIAVDFRADKVLSALKQHRGDEEGRKRFMAEHCCGMRRDATVRTLQAIDAVVAAVRTGTGHKRLVDSMGGEHPLNAIGTSDLHEDGGT